MIYDHKTCYVRHKDCFDNFQESPNSINLIKQIAKNNYKWRMTNLYLSILFECAKILLWNNGFPVSVLPLPLCVMFL